MAVGPSLLKVENPTNDCKSVNYQTGDHGPLADVLPVVYGQPSEPHHTFKYPKLMAGEHIQSHKQDACCEYEKQYTEVRHGAPPGGLV